ncbi:hypothetical protein NC652_015051 [Populus alba x Populus x berolinensis]|nr:hypothetical protein NC652_015051 [Populus alba x Populus x berolinensis]
MGNYHNSLIKKGILGTQAIDEEQVRSVKKRTWEHQSLDPPGIDHEFTKLFDYMDGQDLLVNLFRFPNPNPNLPHCQLPSPHEDKGNLVGLVKPNHLKCLKLTLLWAEGTTLFVFESWIFEPTSQYLNAHRSICILSLFVSFPFYLIISRSLFYHHFQSEFFMETVELKVEMVGIHEKRLRKCLSKLKGIEKVEVDVSSQKVMVTGYVHRNKILKAIRRGGLKADFWSTQDELLSVYASAIDALLCPCVRSRQHVRGHWWIELRGIRLVSEAGPSRCEPLISGLLLHGLMTSITMEFTAFKEVVNGNESLPYLPIDDHVDPNQSRKTIASEAECSSFKRVKQLALSKDHILCQVGVTHYFSFLKAMAATISYWQERKRKTLDRPTIYAWLYVVIGMIPFFGTATCQT